jgi:hypothetical protein
MDMYPVDLEKEKPELYKTLNNNGNWAQKNCLQQSI